MSQRRKPRAKAPKICAEERKVIIHSVEHVGTSAKRIVQFIQTQGLDRELPADTKIYYAMAGEQEGPLWKSVQARVKKVVDEEDK